MNLDNIANQIYIVAYNEAKLRGHEYLVPEHLLYAAILFDAGKEILENSGADIKYILENLSAFFEKYCEKVENTDPIESYSFVMMFKAAEKYARGSEKEKISLTDILIAFYDLNESYSVYILNKSGIQKTSLLKYISHGISVKNASKIKVEQKNNIKTEKENEFLNRYTTELTELALCGKLDPLIGREDILERTMQVLSRRVKNNPVHVGEPGVGKTAIVEGIAQKIAMGNVPDVIKNSKVYYLDISGIIAGTKYRGDFEDRFIKVLDIISKEENPIIYIDEIHTIVGAGAVSGGVSDAAGILKPYLLKGNLKIIGSTTYSEYKKYFEKDRALVRRFQKIDINEPSVKECIEILKGLKNKYEDYHNVKYTEDALISSCTLSNKYINDMQLPDKAIDIIDEAGAYARLHSENKNIITIKEDIIKKIISLTAKIPVEKLTSNETNNLKKLGASLKKEIFGQDKAIESVADAIKLSKAGLTEEQKPIANLLFVGPTGVGKTEIAKQLAKNLGIKLLRFDMSEYQEKHSVAGLIGAPPGYVGYEEGGLLTDSINKTPHCVLLLDEIEKAHKDILNILLQVMDYGTLTDNAGKKADFRNVILIMTSNAGASDIGKNIIGFDDKKVCEDAVHSEVEKIFPPEFRNRLDNIIAFNKLNKEMAILIAKKAINKLNELLNEKNIKIRLTKKAYEFIAQKGFSEKYGAREINRIVDREIKKVITDEILFGKLVKGGSISVDINDDLLNIKYKPATKN